VRAIGPGFHPDTDFATYIDLDKRNLFVNRSARKLNQCCRRAVATLERCPANAYEIGWRECIRRYWPRALAKQLLRAARV